MSAAAEPDHDLCADLCAVCRRLPIVNRNRCRNCRGIQLRPAVRDALVSSITPWEEDHVARLFVKLVGPAEYRVIAAAIGVSYEQVRQIEKKAIKKARHAARRMKLDADAIIEAILDIERRDEEHPAAIMLPSTRDLERGGDEDDPPEIPSGFYSEPGLALEALVKEIEDTAQMVKGVIDTIDRGSR